MVPSTGVVGCLHNMQDQAVITVSPDVLLLEILAYRVDSTRLSVPSALVMRRHPLLLAHGRDRPRSCGRRCHSCADVPFVPSRQGIIYQRIFDCDAWNTSTTNKGCNFIFNTSKELHMVSKIFSGHNTKTNLALQDLNSFDLRTRSTISSFQCHLFNVNKTVLDVLTSSVVRHYSLLKLLSAEAPVDKRIEACTTEAGSSLFELFAWSSHLTNLKAPFDGNKIECAPDIRAGIATKHRTNGYRSPSCCH
ncbi:Hypothetical protein PHPALM_18453 [Phytophthora palmivora]|uniref:Uncharacterized protein n=1 Tax=Phytophthora palmivora TaxID=4796 RepID=A0A2P4XJP4_9STRA|nr:Hypothetical protein PHPALM_18453 [Phytophthora palmivora]